MPEQSGTTTANADAIMRCPALRLDAAHYNPDGTCQCTAPSPAAVPAGRVGRVVLRQASAQHFIDPEELLAGQMPGEFCPECGEYDRLSCGCYCSECGAKRSRGCLEGCSAPIQCEHCGCTADDFDCYSCSDCMTGCSYDDDDDE
jgi:hypothetical protein